MSDYTDLKEVKWFGKKYILRALSGVVMESSQRSDTYVSGGGTQGNSYVNSTVSVTSQFWIVTQSGREVNLQLSGNLSARNGHVMHALDMVDAVTRKDVGENYIAAVNSSTETWWTFKLPYSNLGGRFWATYYPYMIFLPIIFTLLEGYYGGYIDVYHLSVEKALNDSSFIAFFLVFYMGFFFIDFIVFFVIYFVISIFRIIRIEKELFPQLVRDVMPQLNQIAQSLKATKNP